MKIKSYILKCLLLFSFLAVLAGCTNSKIVLSTIYNRLDNQIRNEFNKLGKFEDWQKKEFEHRLQTFHYWHRRQELPRYAVLLREIASVIKTKGNISRANANAWSASLEDFVESVQKCYPAHFAADLMYTLEPEQIRYIERRFARERYKNKTKYAVKTRDQRMKSRLKEIEKWTGLAGFDLTSRQKTMILESMHKTKSLHSEYYALTDRWNKKLFTALRQKNRPDYEENLNRHLGTLYDLMENNHPQTLQYNREVWREFTVDFVQSLTGEQRAWLSTYLRTLGKNLNSISRSKVKFKPHKNVAKGCIPGAGA